MTPTRSVEVYQVDAFTRQPFTGNPAGVVLGAEVLDDAQMQAIARELNNADTAFVLPPTGSDHDLRVRFFTPRSEAAFVGHATLAVHAVLAQRDPRALRRQASGNSVIEVSALPGDGGFSIRMPAPTLGRTLHPDEVTQAIDALGLASTAVDLGCPPRIAGKLSTRLLIGLEDAGALATMSPDLSQLARLSPVLGAAGYFLYATRGTRDGCDVESRMFCPALGIPEDPVSGNAHGLLGGLLLEHGRLQVSNGQARFSGLQGHHMDRPGRVDVALDVGADGSCQGVRIGGQAVVVFQTRITL